MPAHSDHADTLLVVWYASYAIVLLYLSFFDPMHCQFCSSRKTRLLGDTLFCENCEIYFTLKRGIQLIKSLPIVETKQRFLSLCPSCSGEAAEGRTIRCRTFREYLRRLPYCNSCRSLNYVFLKNLFFKNFLLYKKIKRVFGAFTFLALAVIWGVLEKYTALMYYYTAITAGDMSVSGFFGVTFLLYHLNRYEFVRFIIFLLCLYKLLTKKSIYFEVPVNLLTARGLGSFIDRLNINGSFEEIHKRDAGKMGVMRNSSLNTSQPSFKTKLG